MSKYGEGLRFSIVERYLSGDESSESAGRRYGVDPAAVRKWVASYRAHGAAGLARKFSRYDAEFKRSVLQRMWEEWVVPRVSGLPCIDDLVHAFQEEQGP